MVRPEITGKRELNFSKWIREKLPDSSFGYLVSDLDWIICNYKTKEIILLEVKTRNKRLPIWQKRLFENLNRWIKKGIDDDWQYYGFHILRFENTFFDDGKVYFDDKEIDEDYLIGILNFKP